MKKTLTASLVATTMQKLEAIRLNEAEVLSDEESYKRAEEVAEAALQAIAVCAKYLLARNAEARIDGLGSFYVTGAQVQFIPDQDVTQYVLLKHQEPKDQQLALRNALVRDLSQARKLVPLLDLTQGVSVSAEDSEANIEDKLMGAVFSQVPPDNFDRSVSFLLNELTRELQEAGADVRIGRAISAAEQLPTPPHTSEMDLIHVTVSRGGVAVWDWKTRLWIPMEKAKEELAKAKGELQKSPDDLGLKWRQAPVRLVRPEIGE